VVHYDSAVPEETILGSFILNEREQTPANNYNAGKNITLELPNLHIIQKYLRRYSDLIEVPLNEYFIENAESEKSQKIRDAFKKGVDEKALDLIDKNSLSDHIVTIANEIDRYFSGKHTSLKYFKEPEDTEGYSALIIQVHTETFDEKHIVDKRKFQNEWFFDYIENNNIDIDIVISLV
jgi:hypothetical protein